MAVGGAAGANQAECQSPMYIRGNSIQLLYWIFNNGVWRALGEIVKYELNI